jgi:hypothetical protein
LIYGKAFSKTSAYSRNGPHKLAPTELDGLDCEIASTDSESDKLVYELYGITGDEGKNIEEVRERDAT